ncbi:AraC family transcriptional regulator ligand-binding domain-containing protein [Paraburkholderia tuberum]|uniref:AraC family transcriptional regulator ligand-binding domain-containing protein n=1 Tax=Paraburkholderia TaxID=1822464 RepID=UPI0009FE621D|nr:hypothetical protein [Paraburkholderia sp. WSM4179]
MEAGAPVVVQFSMQRTGERAELHLRFRQRDPASTCSILTYQIFLLSTYALRSWLTGQRVPVTSIDFPCSPPHHQYELRMLPQSLIRFDQPHADIRFPTQANAYASSPDAAGGSTIRWYLRIRRMRRREYRVQRAARSTALPHETLTWFIPRPKATSR